MLKFLEKALRFGEGKKMSSLQETVDAVSALGPEISERTDSELRAKTDEFRGRLSEGETVDDLLTEAFAVVREVADRVLGMRPFDVQVMGAIVLHQGSIAEMKTSAMEPWCRTIAPMT